MERVDVLQPGEALEDGGKLLGEGLLCELNLSSIEGWRYLLVRAEEGENGWRRRVFTSDATDFEAGTDLGREPPLGATENDVQEFL